MWNNYFCSATGWDLNSIWSTQHQKNIFAIFYYWKWWNITMQSSILGRISRKLFISAQLKVMHFLNKIEQWIRGIGNNRNSISGVENMEGKNATTPCRAPLDKMSGMASRSKNGPFKDETIYRSWMHYIQFFLRYCETTIFNSYKFNALYFENWTLEDRVSLSQWLWNHEGYHLSSVVGRISKHPVYPFFHVHDLSESILFQYFHPIKGFNLE